MKNDEKVHDFHFVIQINLVKINEEIHPLNPSWESPAMKNSSSTGNANSISTILYE